MRCRLAPILLLALLSGCIASPETRQQQPVRRSTAYFSPAPEARECLASLGQHGATFTPLPDQYFGAGCAQVNAVRLFAVATDHADLGITNATAIACPLADRVAAWARFGVDRAARQYLGSPLVRIETMGAYSCRDIAGTERLSEHARANAVDVSGFVLADGRHITILGNWYAGTPPERAFLRAIHTSACRRFSTVLGPDYNVAHHNHLHLDLAPTTLCR